MVLAALPPARRSALPWLVAVALLGAALPAPPGALAGPPAPGPGTIVVPFLGALALDGGGGVRLGVPYRSQFDGSPYEWGNCGVAAIAMAMEYYGQPWSTHAVREAINAMTGNWAAKAGVDWRYLKLALERRGFTVDGPYDGRGGYRSWTLEDVLAATARGHPALLLVHYRSLPGHEDDEWPGDHYIIVLGLTRDGRVRYHDPGFPGGVGAGRTLDRAAFERAWSRTWVGQDRTAMVVLGPAR